MIPAPGTKLPPGAQPLTQRQSMMASGPVAGGVVRPPGMPQQPQRQQTPSGTMVPGGIGNSAINRMNTGAPVQAPPPGVPNYPAPKPPQVNAGMGPQPQVGQQPMTNSPQGVPPFQRAIQLPNGGWGVDRGAPQPPPQQRVQSGGGQPQQMMPQGFPGQPNINTGPVYTQQQQDQLINQAIGRNAMAEGGQNMAVIDRLTGGGFAAGGSPRAMAMQNQNAVGRMQADNAARTGIPLQLAQVNAQHQLAAQQAAENQYANRMGERLTGQGQQLNFLNGLFGSLLT